MKTHKTLSSLYEDVKDFYINLIEDEENEAVINFENDCIVTEFFVITENKMGDLIISFCEQTYTRTLIQIAREVLNFIEFTLELEITVIDGYFDENIDRCCTCE